MTPDANRTANDGPATTPSTLSSLDESGNLERGPFDFREARKSAPRGARAFLWITGVLATAITLGFLYHRYAPSVEMIASSDLNTTKSGITNRLETPQLRKTLPARKPEEPAKPVPAPLPIIVQATPPAPSMADLVADRQLASPLQAGGNEQSSGNQNARQNARTQTGASAMQDAGPLADKLRPLELVPSVAGQLGNRNFLITQGTMIECALITRLVTTQPGLLTCLATHDIMSANGMVKLIDRGTKFTGYQSNGMTQGQARAFVTWNRLETPTGVILNLASPGTGPLGEAGVSGYVDNHFWDRFGNAILLSLIGDLGAWATNQGQRGDNNVSFDTTLNGGQEVITTILERSLDIPPTLYKNQGERIGIMVARDLDFSLVYDLKTTPALTPTNASIR
jgi:type IV secretion system protein VirB10